MTSRKLRQVIMAIWSSEILSLIHIKEVLFLALSNTDSTPWGICETYQSFMPLESQSHLSTGSFSNPWFQECFLCDPNSVWLEAWSIHPWQTHVITQNFLPALHFLHLTASSTSLPACTPQVCTAGLSWFSPLPNLLTFSRPVQLWTHHP